MERINILKILKELNLDIVKIKNGEAIIRCPFHDDLLPSLFVNLERGWVKDFGGCIKGNIIDLVAKCLDTNYIEASRLVESNSLDNVINSSDLLAKLSEVGKENAAKSILDKSELDRFEKAWHNNAGNKYLLGRGFTNKTIKEFGILYADDTKDIVIPVYDELLNLRSIIRRNIYAKIFNNLHGYSLVSLLFGLPQLDLGGTKEIFLVEGSFDCMKMHQLGFKNTLALMGTSFSRERKNILLNHCTKVNLLLDPDDAGIKSANEISKVLLPEIRIFYISLKEDPCESSREDIEEAIAKGSYYFPKRERRRNYD